MMDLRIGTILIARDALRQMPKLVENGFECFEITFGESTRAFSLPDMAAKIRGGHLDAGCVRQRVGRHGHPRRRAAQHGGVHRLGTSVRLQYRQLFRGPRAGRIGGGLAAPF